MKTFIGTYLFTIFLLLCQLPSLNAKDSPTPTIDQLQTEINKKTPPVPSKRYELANLLLANSSFSEALYHLKTALQELKPNEIALRAKILERIGYIYSENNELQSAITYYLKAKSTYEKIHDDNSTGRVLIHIATINLKISKLQKARTYLLSAKKLYQKQAVKNKTELVNCYFLLGIVYGNLEVLDSSLYYFNQCEEFYSHENTPILYAGVLNNIGAIYSKMGNNSAALEKYYTALTTFEEIDNKTGIGVTISNIAYIKQKDGLFQEAIQLFNTSNTYLNTSNDLYYLQSNHSNLSDIYKELNDFKKAFIHLEKQLEIKNKIADDDVLSKISEIEKKHELTKKENENRLIAKEVELKSKTLWFILFACVLLLLIILLVYRNARISLQKTRLKEALLESEKKKLSEKLRYKSKELEQFALMIVEKNNFLDRVKTDVKEVVKNFQDEPKIKSISAQLNQNIQLEQDRKKFEFQLDENLKSFFHNLESRYPNLTKSEKKLASLLVLDLSSKDIAAVFNISLDGVKKSRYRLRKKLNLETDKDLSSFLKNI